MLSSEQALQRPERSLLVVRASKGSLGIPVLEHLASTSNTVQKKPNRNNFYCYFIFQFSRENSDPLHETRSEII